MVTVNDLMNAYKTPYRIKVKSKRAPGFEWEVIGFRFDEITRERVILIAINELPSDRINNAPMVIAGLLTFQKKWPVYVYFKDKVVTLPVVELKVDDSEKKVILYVE